MSAVPEEAYTEASVPLDPMQNANSMSSWTSRAKQAKQTNNQILV
jgi:hypothetical protein